jgi:hypothetical protein
MSLESLHGAFQLRFGPMEPKLAVLASLAVLAGCASSIVASSVATDGQVMQAKLVSGDALPENSKQVIAASGAHDLPCTAAAVRVTREGTRWLAEGCGGRTIYDESCLRAGEGDPEDYTGHESTRIPPDTDVVCRLKLLGRVPLPTEPAPAR